MSDTTSNRDYPFPQTSDDYVPHADVEALAEAVDADIQAIDDANITGRPRFNCNFGTPSLTNNTITTLTPSAANANVGSMWPGSGTNITVPSAKEYEIGIVLRYASQAVAAGMRQARININGSEYMTFQEVAVSNLNATNIIVCGVIRIVLAALDVVSFGGYQNSGGALALAGNSRGWVDQVVQ